MRHTFDIAVVGAGPAGIAAAVTAAERGARVALVDDNPTPGGQIWRGKSSQINPRVEAADGSHDNAHTWFARLDNTNVVKCPQTSIVSATASNLSCANRDAAFDIACTKLILATGGRELFLPFPGWTLPGVFGVGALQALSKAGLQVRGKRVLLAGTGPLLLAVASHLIEGGATVPLVAEQASTLNLLRFTTTLLRSPGKIAEAWAMRDALAATELLPSTWPARVERIGSQLRVSFRASGGTRTETCDYLGCAFGLTPNVELPTHLGCALSTDGFVTTGETCETSIGGVFAAGELTGIGGVEKSLVEGQIAAISATRAIVPPKLAKQLVKAKQFASALAKSFSPRAELRSLADARTIVCRCEDVTVGTASARGGLRDAKLQTRCGMGACQGRVCGPALRFLFGWENVASPRPPLVPVSLGKLISKDGSTPIGS